MRNCRFPWRYPLVLLLATTCCLRGAEARMVITRFADPAKLIPVSVEGFSGETASALGFDLRVQGFGITNSAAAELRIQGSQSDRLIGRVFQRGSREPVFSKQYTGGSVRSRVHSFSDDVVALIPGRIPIAKTKIAFRVENGGRSEIFIADYDGHNAVPVTRDQTINRDPAWAPGGRMLYYTALRSGFLTIFSHDLPTGARQFVARYPSSSFAPAVSPDGQRLAMILGQSGNPDLYVSGRDGLKPQQLTRTRGEESSPCWSPDSRSICVVSTQSGARPGLYLVPAGGGEMKRLPTTGVLNTTEPSWSPDGTTIALTALMGSFQICTVKASGGVATPLCQGEDPSWAPNSRALIFTRRVSGKRVLSLLDVPTKRVFDLPRISGSCSQPDWAR